MRSGQNTRSGIGKSGFTMIEVMIAIVVLSVGLLGIASMQLTAVKDNAGANRLTESATLAQDKIEELMGLPFNDPDLQDGTYQDPPTPAGYTIEWDVENNTPQPNTTLITVTVTWAEIGWFNWRTDQADQRETVLTSVRPQVW